MVLFSRFRARFGRRNRYVSHAGKLAPARVLVLGAGVAGLAAIQTAKNMGAVVFGYDVRPVVKEQVESMGGQFLKVPYEEDGAGQGGYAKEMSDEYKKAEQAMLTDEVAKAEQAM